MPLLECSALQALLPRIPEVTRYPLSPWDLADVKKDKPGKEVRRAEEPGVAEGQRGQDVWPPGQWVNNPPGVLHTLPHNQHPHTFAPQGSWVFSPGLSGGERGGGSGGEGSRTLPSGYSLQPGRPRSAPAPHPRRVSQPASERTQQNKTNSCGLPVVQPLTE